MKAVLVGDLSRKLAALKFGHYITRPKGFNPVIHCANLANVAFLRIHFCDSRCRSSCSIACRPALPTKLSLFFLGRPILIPTEIKYILIVYPNLISTCEFRAIHLHYVRNVILYRPTGLVYIVELVYVPFNDNQVLKEIIYMIMIFVRSVGGSSIRNANITDERDSEFVQELQSLGVNRNVALVITFLKDQNERYFKDIEIATDLKQQKVSVAMQTLRERGWLKEHDIEGIRRGRRFRIYALQATIGELINYYEAEKSMEAAMTSEAIQRLKELSTQKEISPS